MQHQQQPDESFGSHSLQPWIAPLTVGGLFLLMAIIGTYTLNWTWTGFKGNTLWDWLHLLIVPVALGIATIWLTQQHKWRPGWTFALWSLGLLLIVLEIATYAFNWNWTGFKGNKLWDWLNLLLLPLTMTLVSIWFGAPHRWRPWWTQLIWIAITALALLAICSYLFNWTWTGFKGNTLWDWLSMLLLPAVLTAATIWFTAPQVKKRKQQMALLKTQKQGTQGETPTEIVAANLEEAHEGEAAQVIE